MKFASEHGVDDFIDLLGSGLSFAEVELIGIE